MDIVNIFTDDLFNQRQTVLILPLYIDRALYINGCIDRICDLNARGQKPPVFQLLLNRLAIDPRQLGKCLICPRHHGNSNQVILPVQIGLDFLDAKLRRLHHQLLIISGSHCHKRSFKIC